MLFFKYLAPPQFEIKMRNQTARRSEPAVLQCQAKGEKVKKCIKETILKVDVNVL